MDICTITQFRNALTTPRVYLNRLTNINFDPSTLMRNKYFAECCAEQNGQQIMLYAPITPTSLRMAQQAIELFDATDDELSSLTLLSNEMYCGDVNNSYCSIVMEQVVDGTLLSEALYTSNKTRLLRGLKELDNSLKKYDISINHLHPDSIVVDSKHHWHLLRAFYATPGYGNDTLAIEKIRELIERCSITDYSPSPTLREEISTYEYTACNKPKSNPLCEGRRRFTSGNAIGFEDERGNVIIDAIYYAASDFIEERAEVENFEHRMGLIDRYGNYIIECIYDKVEFCVDDGSSRVYKDGLFAEFNYFGQRETEWIKEYK